CRRIRPDRPGGVHDFDGVVGDGRLDGVRTALSEQATTTAKAMTALERWVDPPPGPEHHPWSNSNAGSRWKRFHNWSGWRRAGDPQRGRSRTVARASTRWGCSATGPGGYETVSRTSAQAGYIRDLRTEACRFRARII